MSFGAEITTKVERARALMAAYDLHALWLRRVENVAWITGGLDTTVNTAAALGVASVLITPTEQQVWTNTIEAPRLLSEGQVEVRGFELVATPWYEAAPQPRSRRLGVDYPLTDALDVNSDLAVLRARLLPVETERFHHLAIACGEAMQRTINRVRPGHSEHEIAAALDYEVRSHRITPLVVLVAADERVARFRHPVPTQNVLDQYAMLVLCGRRDGLVCSVTRLVHFGPLPDDLRRRMDACAEVDATMLAASQPGATLGEVFRVAQETYARVGYADEWKLHHQGGLAGYTAREVLAGPNQPTVLEAGMVCAWNPSITGTKCEDSMRVPAAGETPEVLTWMYGWPTRTVTVNGHTLQRPVIMVL